MENLKDIFKKLKIDSDRRYDNFGIEPISSISRISEETYLEKPTWLGGDEKFICLFIDLDDSTQISRERNRATVSKIYDYFTQNIYNILTIPEFSADYIDIKGDGLFGIYEGEKAVFKSFVAAVTFKTFFEKYIKNKFSENNIILKCKISIDRDKVLVKKIGGREDYNEVWAGELINNAFKIASLNKKIYEQDTTLQTSFKEDLIIVSEDIYKKLKEKKDYAILSCGHETDGKWTGKRVDLWKKFADTLEDSQCNDIVYYLSARWCGNCGDQYISEILK
ncbi:hypothetical protein AMJ47_01270 [Parcubacteria bacterium DG_72]|nr:MAG: hypothetical protein AMJ47_01270 [Parcubacteria bacterium DG_72]